MKTSQVAQTEQIVSRSQFLIENKDKITNKNLLLSQSDKLKNINNSQEKPLANIPQSAIPTIINNLSQSVKDKEHCQDQDQSSLSTISAILGKCLDIISDLKTDVKAI